MDLSCHPSCHVSCGRRDLKITDAGFRHDQNPCNMEKSGASVIGSRWDMLGAKLYIAKLATVAC